MVKAWYVSECCLTISQKIHFHALRGLSIVQRHHRRVSLLSRTIIGDKRSAHAARRISSLASAVRVRVRVPDLTTHPRRNHDPAPHYDALAHSGGRSAGTRPCHPPHRVFVAMHLILRAEHLHYTESRGGCPACRVLFVCVVSYFLRSTAVRFFTQRAALQAT